MSWVNNAVVFYGCGERPERMEEVNDYISSRDSRGQKFGCGDDWRTEWYGGTKVMEANMWGAAFNYVDFDTVMEALMSTKWQTPENVILLWQGQQDYQWRIYKLGDEENTEDYWR